MGSLLPLKPTNSPLRKQNEEPVLIDIADDEEETEQILSSVSSTTARKILKLIYDEPRTASDIANEIDSSVQNVSYHLDRLFDAKLIEVAGTWYSGQGREMNVYAPANGPVVLFLGAEEKVPSLSTALKQVFAGIGIMGVISGLVHSRWASTQSGQVYLEELDSLIFDSHDPTVVESVIAFATGPGGSLFGIGVILIVSWFVYWYWQTYLPYARQRSNTIP